MGAPLTALEAPKNPALEDAGFVKVLPPSNFQKRRHFSDSYVVVKNVAHRDGSGRNVRLRTYHLLIPTKSICSVFFWTTHVKGRRS
jgi:hypothetical protein